MPVAASKGSGPFACNILPFWVLEAGSGIDGGRGADQHPGEGVRFLRGEVLDAAAGGRTITEVGTDDRGMDGGRRHPLFDPYAQQAARGPQPRYLRDVDLRDLRNVVVAGATGFGTEMALWKLAPRGAGVAGGHRITRCVTTPLPAEERMPRGVCQTRRRFRPATAKILTASSAWAHDA